MWNLVLKIVDCGQKKKEVQLTVDHGTTTSWKRGYGTWFIKAQVGKAFLSLVCPTDALPQPLGSPNSDLDCHHCSQLTS